MRKSQIFAVYTAVNLIALGTVFACATLHVQAARPSLLRKAELVRKLALTDLCLFTDARYTRNPSMADFSSPFQDHPLAFDHFPSGTIVTPPPHVKSP